MIKKIIFLLIFILTLCLIPVVILHNVSLPVVLKERSLIINLAQRILGLTIFILLFWQIIIGEFIDKLKNLLGNWIISFHLWEGISIYVLAILHPLMFLLFRHFTGAGTDPVFVFLGYCGYCQTNLDFYYTLGRFAFLFLTVGAVVWVLKKNWQKFCALNYVVFLIAGTHGFLLGIDFTTRPFFCFSIVSSIVVLLLIVLHIPKFIASYKKWLNG
jgi:hypothetical protein